MPYPESVPPERRRHVLRNMLVVFMICTYCEAPAFLGLSLMPLPCGTLAGERRFIYEMTRLCEFDVHTTLVGFPKTESLFAPIV